MKNRLLAFIIYLLLCLSGCYADTTSSTDGNDNINVIKQKLMETEACSKLSFDKKILPDQYENTLKCYYDIAIQSHGLIQEKEVVHYVSERLLTLNLPKKILTKILEITATTTSSNTELIKKLIDRGASTSNIPTDRIVNHNDVICEPVEYILENNKGLYKKNPVFEKGNSVDASEIFTLVDTYASHHSICTNAIEKLISYYPEAVNLYMNGIPLKYLLYNPEASDVPPELAVKLLSKTNVNMTDKEGDTALHTFIKSNHYKGANPLKKYQKVIDKFIELGGNLDLKNNNGITVRELLIKN